MATCVLSNFFVSGLIDFFRRPPYRTELCIAELAVCSIGTGCSSIGVPVAVAFTVAMDSDKATSTEAPVPDKIRATMTFSVAGCLAAVFI